MLVIKRRPSMVNVCEISVVPFGKSEFVKTKVKVYKGKSNLSKKYLFWLFVTMYAMVFIL